jgi:hypothetical protein
VEEEFWGRTYWWELRRPDCPDRYAVP